MKKLIMFYLDDCGYCHKAHRAIDELQHENPQYQSIEIEKIEEEQYPDIAAQYDYYATPTFYLNGEKLFEAHLFMSYEDIKAEVKKVFDRALDA